MLEKDSKYWFLNLRSENSVSKKVKSKAHLIGICNCKRLPKVIQLSNAVRSDTTMAREGRG